MKCSAKYRKTVRAWIHKVDESSGTILIPGAISNYYGSITNLIQHEKNIANKTQLYRLEVYSPWTEERKYSVPNQIIYVKNRKELKDWRPNNGTG